MKIIGIDNFDREAIGISDDDLIAENLNEYWAKKIVKMLNEQCSGPSHPRYYEVVKDDYKLRKFEP